MLNSLDGGGMSAAMGMLARRKDMNYAASDGGTGNPNGAYNQPGATSADKALDSYAPKTFSMNTPTNDQVWQQSADNMMRTQDLVLNSDNPYIQNARQTGLEHASKRGLLNSSMAAGNSQRAAIEASQPIVGAIYNRTNSLNDFYSTTKLLPLQSALSFSDNFAQLAAQEPDVYTPSYINGMTNFFMSNMQNVMDNFFGDGQLTGGGG